jgi:hypothetical protein
LEESIMLLDDGTEAHNKRRELIDDISDLARLDREVDFKINKGTDFSDLGESVVASVQAKKIMFRSPTCPRLDQRIFIRTQSCRGPSATLLDNAVEVAESGNITYT